MDLDILKQMPAPIRASLKQNPIETRSHTPANPRTKRIEVRLTEAEYASLLNRCGDVTISRYVRAGLFNYPRPRPRVVVSDVNRSTYLELAKIGGNLNQQTQIMRMALAQNLIAASQADELLQVLTHLRALVNQVKVEMAWPLQVEEKEAAEAERSEA